MQQYRVEQTTWCVRREGGMREGVLTKEIAARTRNQSAESKTRQVLRGMCGGQCHNVVLQPH